MNLLKTKDKIYTKQDLLQALANLGVVKNDILCVHSEIYSFGIPCVPAKEYLKILIDSLFELIGKEGTLIMPTFTYSFCKNEIYDKANSKCEVGVLGEFFRKQEGVKRTNDPIFSFAVKGYKEELFLNKLTKSCFDENSTYALLSKNNGKILNFGNKDCFTFVHYPEELAKISYRYHKNFKGIIRDENKNEFEANIDFYVRHKDKLCSDFKIIEFLKHKAYFKESSFASGALSLIEAKAFCQDLLNAFKENENIFRI